MAIIKVCRWLHAAKEKTASSNHAYKACAISGEGNILVADTLNNRVQKFTAEGRFLTAVGKAGSGPLQFNDLTDIAYSTLSTKKSMWLTMRIIAFKF